MPTAKHFLKRHCWHRFRLILMMVQFSILRHFLYWMFCWMLRRKNPCTSTPPPKVTLGINIFMVAFIYLLDSKGDFSLMWTIWLRIILRCFKEAFILFFFLSGCEFCDQISSRHVEGLLFLSFSFFFIWHSFNWQCWVFFSARVTFEFSLILCNISKIIYIFFLCWKIWHTFLLMTF